MTQHGIGRVAGLDLAINDKMDASNWGSPDVVIATAVADELAAGVSQETDERVGIAIDHSSRRANLIEASSQ